VVWGGERRRRTCLEIGLRCGCVYVVNNSAGYQLWVFHANTHKWRCERRARGRAAALVCPA